MRAGGRCRVCRVMRIILSRAHIFPRAYYLARIFSRAHIIPRASFLNLDPSTATTPFSSSSAWLFGPFAFPTRLHLLDCYNIWFIPLLGDHPAQHLAFVYYWNLVLTSQVEAPPWSLHDLI
jgi:hypothetical protein